MKFGNLYRPLPPPADDEVFDDLASGGEFTLQRIVSTGQATAEGEWYDQTTDEWVVLLTGSARLRFETGDELLEMKPGNYVHIPAHCRHRVESTAAGEETVWLALHFKPR